MMGGGNGMMRCRQMFTGDEWADGWEGLTGLRFWNGRQSRLRGEGGAGSKGVKKAGWRGGKSRVRTRFPLGAGQGGLD